MDPPRILRSCHARLRSLPADHENIMGSQCIPFLPSTMKKTRSKRRKKKRSIGGARMGDDLIIEFISRLPTKSLIRFQCVSKSWRSFISYASSKRRSPILLPVSGFFICPILCDPDRGFYATIMEEKEGGFLFESRLKSMPFYSTFYVVHSCNGLLLFRHKQSPSLHYVWNPTSMEYVSLPVPPNRNCYSHCFIAFDPRESPHYNVVRFTITARITTRLFVEIYSSLTGKWIEIDVANRYPFCPNLWDRIAVFHKGSLYMLSHNYLVRFDIENKSFHKILLLQKRNYSPYSKECIGESRGNLYCAVNFTPQYELLICILDKQYYGERLQMKWLPMHTISTKFLDRHPLMTREPAGDRPCLSFRPIAFHMESEVIYLSTPSKILRYHPSSDKLDEVCELTESLDWMKVFSVAPCLESINPPGSKFIDPSAIKNIM